MLVLRFVFLSLIGMCSVRTYQESREAPEHSKVNGEEIALWTCGIVDHVTAVFNADEEDSTADANVFISIT